MEATLAASVFSEEPALREEAESVPLLAALRQRSRTLNVDGETYFVIEGDLLYDEDELRLYALQWERRTKASAVGVRDATGAPTQLAVNTPGGKLVRWPPGLVLTYCVVAHSFPSTSEYDRVVADIQEAATGWESICGVQFSHRQKFDSTSAIGASPTEIAPELTFAVKFSGDLGDSVYASAFFPTYEPNRRWVRVGRSLLSSTDVDPVGVMRHELGHVLGFRHEHILPDAPPSCPDEPLAEVLPVTEYDPRSVMHYPCTGISQRLELGFTEFDRLGAQQVYGPPLSSFWMPSQ